MIKKTLFFFSPILHYITTAMNCKVNKRTREREREPVELIKKRKSTLVQIQSTLHMNRCNCHINTATILHNTI